MSYVPHTDADRAEMLAAIGVEGVEDLFHDVPAAYRFPELNLPAPLSERPSVRKTWTWGISPVFWELVLTSTMCLRSSIT